MRSRTIAAVLAMAALAACGENNRETPGGVDARTSARRTEVDVKPVHMSGVDALADSVAAARAKTTADTAPRGTPR